ncbi:1,2-phenylacetyl-CoA epoxidase subunit PaaC [Bacillus sp. MUM 13]|uniref:1,2-phenylacetyl-CoA epoxidase subunit PaaC n=1 Tax=Bacillus sp. MUM 13 TaxID=1678001 RepID=UPI0008F5F404|nr:1,2-phenylacetyl-CoA epoxidase subunit PaaC [Bacillus sp. MUM 13]OIK14931.1 phenylacetate-CoA oxygenase subunit PaaI [Bacillus sp. MUM 13]
MIIKTAEDAKNDQSYHKALNELLLGLADDDFILSYRGSEWLGLAPHIEEDVAFSSISQDLMGHAVLYYQLLSELGAGSIDALAHERPPEERRNAILLELVNGSGTYLEEPRFDWAFTVVRHYFYDMYKKIKLESLIHSSYQPLSHAAVKIKMEQHYHMMHWGIWFKQLTMSGGEARSRMIAAVSRVWNELEGLLTLGPLEGLMVQYGLIESSTILKNRFSKQAAKSLEEVHLAHGNSYGMISGNGREGEHTADMEKALVTLSEVYRMDEKAVW